MLAAAVVFFSVNSASVSPLVTLVYVVAGGGQVARALVDVLSNRGTRPRREQHNHTRNDHNKTEFSMAMHPCTRAGSL